MPWKEISALDERMRLIVLVKEGLSVTEAARGLGVSRVTAQGIIVANLRNPGRLWRRLLRRARKEMGFKP